MVKSGFVAKLSQRAELTELNKDGRCITTSSQCRKMMPVCSTLTLKLPENMEMEDEGLFWALLEPSARGQSRHFGLGFNR